MRVLIGIALAVSVCLAAPASKILYLAGGHDAAGLNFTYRIGDAAPPVVTAQVNTTVSDSKGNIIDARDVATITLTVTAPPPSTPSVTPQSLSLNGTVGTPPSVPT